MTETAISPGPDPGRPLPLPTARTCGRCRYCMWIAGADGPRYCMWADVDVADWLPACKRWEARDNHD